MFTSFKLNINTHWCSFLKQENCSKPSGKTLPVWNINNLRLLCRRREKQFDVDWPTGLWDMLLLAASTCSCSSSLLLFWRACVNGIFFVWNTETPPHEWTAGANHRWLLLHIYRVDIVPWRPSSHPALGRKENSHISQTIFSPLPRNWTP